MIATVAVATLLAVEVARLNLASAYSETQPGLAERLAPRSPDALAAVAMAQVGMAAAQGQSPPETATARLQALTRSGPLRPEPLLVAAAVAQKAGDSARAEKLLVEARRRNPRSAAARFLLAGLWLGEGRIREGLGEMAALSRLLPESAAQLAPALAQYAATPGALAELKGMVAANPKLKQPLLSALATDPANLRLVLEIDSAVPTPQRTRPPDWHGIILEGLIARGQYERAYDLWRRLSRFEGQRPLLFNADFRTVNAPPPFNWRFASGEAGVAEPAEGRLRVLHYGRDDAVLASQILLLPPGSYHFAVPVSGTIAERGLAWRLRCLRDRKMLMQLELVGAARAQARFDVPAGCGAQVLEFAGMRLDMPDESDALMGPITLERIGQ